jgi:hypothetical protein
MTCSDIDSELFVYSVLMNNEVIVLLDITVSLMVKVIKNTCFKYLTNTINNDLITKF